jgi:hypothetical protein
MPKSRDDNRWGSPPPLPAKVALSPKEAAQPLTDQKRGIARKINVALADLVEEEAQYLALLIVRHVLAQFAHNPGRKLAYQDLWLWPDLDERVSTFNESQMEATVRRRAELLAKDRLLDLYSIHLEDDPEIPGRFQATCKT